MLVAVDGSVTAPLQNGTLENYIYNIEAQLCMCIFI